MVRRSMVVLFALLLSGKVVAGPSLIRVPLVAQGTDYTCGIAALQSVLLYYDSNEDYLEATLAKHLHANRRDGTLTKNITTFARSRGYTVRQHHRMSIDALKASLDRGSPVIVLLQAWPEKPVDDWSQDWEDGHFAVVIGHDADNIYFMDPSTKGTYAFIPTNEFMQRWHDVDGGTRLYQFGIVITKGAAQFNADLITPLE